jgi:hypothetical protein
MATNRLTQLEDIIAANQHHFYQIGKALKQIRAVLIDSIQDKEYTT